MKTKRILATLIAVMMLAAMMVAPASAATGTYKVTINGTSANHTYEAYQIFAGSVTKDTQGNLILSTIEWGDGVDTTTAVGGKTLMEAIQEISYTPAGSVATVPFASCTTAQTIADELAKHANNGAIANLFAAAVGKYLTTVSGVSVNTEGNTYEIRNLGAGYYLVQDKNNTVPDVDDMRYTKYLLTVVGDSAVTVKGSSPTVSKTVHSAATGTFTEYQDASIGDVVYFKLDGNLPSNYGDYSQYYYEFSDTMPDGLTFVAYDGNAEDGVTEQVYVYILHSDDTETAIAPKGDTTPGYELTQSGNTVKVAIADLKHAGVEVHADDHIVVKYGAKVNADAVIGKGTAGTGNRNSVEVIYSNDPNQTADTDAANIHKGHTKEDTATVYTFQLDVTKVDSSNEDKKLANAQFYLYKESTGGAQYAKITDGKLESWVTDKTAATLLVSDAQGAFSVAGLDAGAYFLLEETAPDGYNKLLAPVQVTIATAYTGEELTGLTVEVGDGVPADGDLVTGAVAVTVENKGGTTLPTTGGMGTTIFYIAGVIMMAGAATVLLAKKRAAK